MTRPFVLGLTGSIGMGKTTTAEMFAAEGIPVWDADAAVDRAYRQGGSAVAEIARLRPGAVKDGAVDRAALKAWIAADPDALNTLESVVHPLVADDRAHFIAGTDADIVLVDIPLLYETGTDRQVDAVAVVTAPPDIQRARVLERPGMSEAMFATMLSRQIADAEKRSRADFVIETVTMDAARRTVRKIIKTVRARIDARNRS